MADEQQVQREAEAYRVARRRLRHLHTSLAGRRQDWANNTEQPCSTVRAVAYQSAMQSVHSIIDEIEAIAEGMRQGDEPGHARRKPPPPSRPDPLPNPVQRREPRPLGWLFRQGKS